MTQISAQPQASAPETTFRLSVSTEAGNSSLLVTVDPPAAPGANGTPAERAPVDLCCVIDVSGSMDDDAAVPSEQDKPIEVTGLSIMDITKHALRTILASLKEGDRLALVSFSSSAKVVANLTAVSGPGRDTLSKAIDHFRPDASTNLWDGLRSGMNLLNAHEQTSDRLQAIFLLTDGQPNVNPPRGHGPMLKQYLETNPQTAFTINMFGFGYHLDSKLLSDMSNLGGGTYGFIPDAGMVGTVFVHAMANLFATCATRATLSIELPEGVTLKPVAGSHPVSTASWGATVDIGDIQYGQPRQFILDLDGRTSEQEITVTLGARPWFSSNTERVTQTAIVIPTPSSTVPAEYHLAKFRLDLVTYIYNLCRNHPKYIANSNAQTHFTSLASEIERLLPSMPTPADWQRTLKANSPSPSPRRSTGIDGGYITFPASHAHTNVNNAAISRMQVDAIFDAIPPPKPTKKIVTQAPNYNTGFRGTSAQALYSMSQYNQRTRTTIRVDQVIRGTVVQTLCGPRTVVCVIKTPIQFGSAALCTMGSLRITPWHPMQHEESGEWAFPVDIVSPTLQDVPAIYSFVLQHSPESDAHSMIIGGTTCVTMGHGILSGDDVRAHAFFGSYAKVLRAVERLPGFNDAEGIVTCAGVVRDTNGFIKGLLSPKLDVSPVAVSFRIKQNAVAV
ncbi:hypothetical protein PIIN_06234 [Serendipita indica DSM 11827]|uniref:VWFA domain-containing protein n=1 Tax=Serendipita indica (strain DSM 11827) TaxID=1109443 RepID=G4TLV7_SERID|nr:hypothetical protein PIIN_06234 [Serendipita indica DSM 11827]